MSVAKVPESTTELPTELVLKHPLQNRWSLWFYKNERTKTWEENLMHIASFGTVEDFWALYNHVELLSRLPIGCDYSIFKDGIKPMWEDERNRRGGKWLLKSPLKQRHTDLNNFWLEVILLMIGQGFEDSGKDICGAVAQVRNKVDKIAVWTADSSHNGAIMKIGKAIKHRLNLTNKSNFGYEAHADSQNKKAREFRYVL